MGVKEINGSVKESWVGTMGPWGMGAVQREAVKSALGLTISQPQMAVRRHCCKVWKWSSARMQMGSEASAQEAVTRRKSNVVG